MNYMESRSHFKSVLNILRWALPLVLGLALIFMGLRMAFATWVGIN